MLKKTISFKQFAYEFERLDRQNTFSEEALTLIYENLNECSLDVELDVIELCGIYTEMDKDEYKSDYSTDVFIGFTKGHCVLIMHC